MSEQMNNEKELKDQSWSVDTLNSQVINDENGRKIVLLDFGSDVTPYQQHEILRQVSRLPDLIREVEHYRERYRKENLG